MKETIRILKDHAKRYPLMQPCDSVKLVYQSVFGPGHMIKSEKAAAAFLEQEYSAVPHNHSIRFEPLGSTARVYLDAPMTEAQLSLIARMFCASAKRFPAGWDAADDAAKKEFGEKIGILRALAANHVFSFDRQTLDDYLRTYRANGCPPVSHSNIYRAAYAPAYRVIDDKFVRLFDVLQQIGTLHASLPRTVIAIDGRCASGKSTAAELIAATFPAGIIHMDDFFLPGVLRTPERLAETGGNLHRERFITEVLPHLRGKKSFSHRVFDCSTFAYAKKRRKIKPGKLLICEGSYALHPDFGRYFDLAVFSDIAPEEQLRRIRERDGEQMLAMFRERWIPMEEQYFNGMNVRERCDFIVN